MASKFQVDKKRKSAASEAIVTESKAFHRHIKRYIQAPTHRFAVIVPPELASICEDELFVLGIRDTQITEAGVEFTGRLTDCYMANLWLRTASRVLCRFPSFRAGATEELFHKVSTIPWELWLAQDIPLEVDAFVEHSRISHEGLVEKTVHDAVWKRFRLRNLSGPQQWGREMDSTEQNAEFPSSSWKQRLLLHLRENQCQLSVDTTGPHLHQRGYRLRHAGAPLRETLAAAILMKAGWHGDLPLIDGMCGSGTIPIEAALLARRIPSGIGRHFLFENWPSFEEKTWNYMRRKAMDMSLPDPKAAIIGVDYDTDVLELAMQNAERAGVRSNIEWQGSDFLSFEPKTNNIAPGLVVINPPYGKRLHGGGKALYSNLGVHLRRSFEGWRVAVLAPERSLAMSLNLHSARLWNVKHGGIPLVVVIGKC